MNTCHTCKYWKSKKEWGKNDDVYWLTCAMDMNDGTCRRVSEDNLIEKAQVIDHESYKCELITFKDFGCTQWEEKINDS